MRDPRLEPRPGDVVQAGDERSRVMRSTPKYIKACPMRMFGRFWAWNDAIYDRYTPEQWAIAHANSEVIHANES